MTGVFGTFRPLAHAVIAHAALLLRVKMLMLDSGFSLDTPSKSLVAQSVVNSPALAAGLLAVARRAFLGIRRAIRSRLAICNSTAAGRHPCKFCGAKPGRRSRWNSYATQPARPTRWAATSYWSTRNRRPPTGLAWLDAAGARGQCVLQLQMAMRLIANEVADLGSDPHSASQTKIRLPNITEWGSDPNSAAHNTKTKTQKQPSNSASPITGQRQPTGHIGLLGSLFRPAGRERAGGVSGEKSI